MELMEGSETSANQNQTPGKYPKENIEDSKHGESLKPRNLRVTYVQNNFVYDAFMAGDRNTVTQLYRVIPEERSIFCEVII